MSVNIELNTKEINNVVCLNVLKMLKRRKLIDNVDTSFEEIKDDINQKAIIEFRLNNDTLCSIYFVTTKINSIAEKSQIDEYLSNNILIHKILILKEAAKRVLKQIQTEYKNTEYFFENEMIIDITTIIIIPVHILLEEEEKKELLLKYEENKLLNILDNDPMARYYNAKVGDIFKIIRSSIVAGNSVIYRKVVHSDISIFIES